MSIIVPRTKAQVEISGDLIKYIAGNRSLTIEQVKTLIQGLLDEALEDTIFETEIWIDTHVPKRSGDLIQSLKDFLYKSRPPPSPAGELRNLRLVLGVGAEIPYAKYVNEMPIGEVRHLGTWLEHSGKLARSKGQPVYLDDPRAEGFFFEKLVEYAKERLRINLDKAKYKLQSGSVITSRNLTKIQVS